MIQEKSSSEDETETTPDAIHVRLTSESKSKTSNNDNGNQASTSTSISTPPVATTNIITMSSIVENFDKLFEVATTSPNYTEKMTSALTPMFEHLSTKLTANFMVLSNTLSTNMTETIKQELKYVKQELSDQKQKTTDLELRVNNLEKQNELLTTTLRSQQQYLETVDFDRRKQNLILTGIAEVNTTQGNQINEDQDKVKEILTEIGHGATEIAALQRLGQNRGPGGRPRPLKLTLKDSMKRVEILRDSRKLKEANEASLHAIYINKDTHPGIQREERRLRQVVREEKNKPENIGKNIRNDRKEKCVKIDDLVIDKYQPSFF
jgi:hypothetical protein